MAGTSSSWATGLLQAAGLRVTAPRRALLQLLAEWPMPASHAELSAVLGERQGMDRATVYRNLLTLAASGILVRTRLGGSVWRYALAKGRGADHGLHPHFICIDCGGIDCLPAAAAALAQSTPHLPARAEVTEVQLRGHCAACHPPAGSRREGPGLAGG